MRSSRGQARVSSRRNHFDAHGHAKAVEFDFIPHRDVARPIADPLCDRILRYWSIWPIALRKGSSEIRMRQR